jgi:hypothetical protein
VLFVLLGLFAREAHAVSTEIMFYNNTQATLTGPAVSPGQNWSPCFDSTVAGGPPQTIAPGQTVCLGTANSSGFLAGTGGTITYTLNPPTVYGANGNPITLPSLSVALEWSTPWASLPPIGDNDWGCGASITSCIGGGPPFGSCNTGGAESDYSFNYQSGGQTYTCSSNGTYVQFALNDPTPTASFALRTVAGGLSGKSGTPVSITGTNFDTKGYTEVLFGSNRASVSCPASTECVAIAPAGSGVVPVTLNVMGEWTTVGQFSYLPTPSCTYSATEGANGTVWVSCTVDPSRDPILIWQVNGAGVWEIAYSYPVTSPNTAFPMMSGVAPGTSFTFVGCTEGVDFNSEPGSPGCDNVAGGVTIPHPVCSGLGCVHI